MKKLLVAAAIVAGSAGIAAAADMPVKAPVVAPLPSWIGVYGGISAGYAWGDVDWTYFNAPPNPQSVGLSPSGFMAGAHIGAQYQWSQFVIGVEAAYYGGQEVKDEGLDAPIFAPTFNARAEIQDLVTVGGRLGWAFSNWMIYGSGGFAQSNVETAFILRATGVATVASDHHGGWYFGGGIEYLLSKNFYVGVEYKHVELDTGRHSTPPPLLAGPITRFVDPSFDLVQVRVGVKIP